MTVTDTSRESVRLMLKGIGSTPFPDDLQPIVDNACSTIAALLARAEGRREALREALTFIDGATLIVAPETASQRIGADSIRGQLCEVVKALLDADATAQKETAMSDAMQALGIEQENK